MSAVVDVIKLDIAQRETWRYEGLVLRRSPDSILVEARLTAMTSFSMGSSWGEMIVLLRSTIRTVGTIFLRFMTGTMITLKGWYATSLALQKSATVGFHM